MPSKKAEQQSNKGGRPSRGDTEALHPAILDAAETIFLSSGFARASVNAIAAMAGTSKQTVYTRFSTKEALFLAVSNRLLSRQLSNFQSQASDLQSQLLDVCDDILRAILDEKMVRMYSIIMAEADRFPELARLSDEDEYFAGRGALMAILESHLDELNMSADQLRPAMLMLQDMVLAGPLRSAALGLEVLDPSDYRARSQFAVAVFLNGLAR